MIRKVRLEPFSAPGAVGITFSLCDHADESSSVIDPGRWVPVLKSLAHDLNAIYRELRDISECHSKTEYMMREMAYGKIKSKVDPIATANILYITTCENVADDDRPVVDISNLVGFCNEMRRIY